MVRIPGIQISFIVAHSSSVGIGSIIVTLIRKKLYWHQPI